MELLEDKLRVWLDSAKFVKPHSGVYVLYNRNKEPIFIGETNNMERTFTEYVDSEFSESECKQKTQFYQREFTDNQKERQLQLIEVFKSETGMLPICNSEIKVETN
jgi:excinuclease UvrABC nuclease subunit